jgi:tetratricopeptide (TPR) repeat protein
MIKRPTRFRTLLIIAALGGVALVFGTRSLWRGLTPPQLVIPDRLGDLEPRVQKYISSYLEGVRSEPGDAKRWAQFGLVLAANKLWSDAYRCFENAMTLGADQVLPHYYMGVSRQERGDAAGAVEIFEQVIRRFPDFAPAYFGAGDYILASGRLDEAATYFRNTIRCAAARPEGYVGLADVKLRKHDYGGALEQLASALRQAPRLPRARYLRGLALRGLGKRAEAERELALGVVRGQERMRDDWTDALAAHDKRVSGQTQRAMSYAHAGDHRRAVTILEAALKWAPEDVRLLNNLTVAHLGLKQPKRAMELAERAWRLDEGRYETYIMFSLCQQALGALPKALESIDRAIALAPTTARCHYTRARILRKLDRNAEALAAMEEATRLNPTDYQMLAEKGIVLLALNRTEDARRILESAIRWDPTMLPAYFNLFVACMRLKLWDDAARVLAGIRKLAPDHPQVRVMSAQLSEVRSQ